MKADYKNWIPTEMLTGIISGFLVSVILFVMFGVRGVMGDDFVKTIAMFVFGILSIILFVASLWVIYAYRAFSYNGSRHLSKDIIEGVSEHVYLPAGGKGLDVGCGSAALTIACARKNPQGIMIGVDKWGQEYSAFTKDLCERNARAEGIHNVDFLPGDANKLDFDDESFDAVTSNYVYHNIHSTDKQELLLESLRVLKKGGCFAIHDIMGRAYGDMEDFAQKLKDMGYEEVKLIKTDDGKFMTSTEAKIIRLNDSTLLVGKK